MYYRWYLHIYPKCSAEPIFDLEIIFEDINKEPYNFHTKYIVFPSPSLSPEFRLPRFQ